MEAIIRVPSAYGCFAKQLHQYMGRKLQFDDLGSIRKKIEPAHDRTNKMACAHSEDSDQPGHLPSLIRVFAVR